MKKNYNKPEIKVIKVDTCDIICTSPRPEDRYRMNIFEEDADSEYDCL